MLFALIFCQSLNRLQRGLSAIAELLVDTAVAHIMHQNIPFSDEKWTSLAKIKKKIFI